MFFEKKTAAKKVLLLGMKSSVISRTITIHFYAEIVEMWYVGAQRKSRFIGTDASAQYEPQAAFGCV